ncbi:hypothetical protein ABZ371_00150 [Streptomyces sp. NPDC005899]|uniref:hypothetical protein n=1 Tax=Streptomyces sp. NPDC005899 TaxID=3155716 RepID=UPI003401873D
MLPSRPGDERRAIELLGRVRYGRLATSMRALPFLAVARHLVVDGHVVLRMHRGLGHHESCDGSVIAYGADNLDSRDPSRPGGTGDARDGAGDARVGTGDTRVGTGEARELWSVQCTGPAEIVRPGPEQRALFGTGPAAVDGEPFDPVYLRLDPHVIRMHTLSYDASP